uniref:APH domain-containing protein n=1 Tax=Ascaris lumbricoides TaxID=6252 RepID=A0A0M3I7Z2_ASCLU
MQTMKGQFDSEEYILATPIKWSWLEENLCTSLNTSAKFGADCTAQQVGAGQGYMSVMARIHPKWTESNGSLPQSIIAKIPSLKYIPSILNDQKTPHNPCKTAEIDSIMDNLEKNLNNFHNTEVSLYAMVQDNDLHLKIPKTYVLQKFDDECAQGVIVMEDMGEQSIVFGVYHVISVDDIYQFHNTEVSLYAMVQDNDLHLKIPKTYVLQKFDDECAQGVIVMEDMGEQSIVFGVYHVISVDDIYQIIDQLVELHKFSFEHPECISSIGRFTLARFLRMEDHAKCFLVEAFSGLVRSLRYLEKDMAPMLDHIADLWYDICDADVIDNIHNLIGMPAVLVHGDLWTANTIWREHNGKRELAAIVDWQVRSIFFIECKLKNEGPVLAIM